jgi:hypothetical protein
LFAGLGAGEPPLFDDDELDESFFFGDGAGELPPSDPPLPGPPPGPGAAAARFHRSGREAGRDEVGCTETWAASRALGDAAECATAATGGAKPGPTNIAQATTTAPTPGARDQSTTRGTARSRGRLLDGTDTTHPHVGQVRTRPRREIKKMGRHCLAARGGRSGRTAQRPGKALPRALRRPGPTRSATAVRLTQWPAPSAGAQVRPVRRPPITGERDRRLTARPTGAGGNRRSGFPVRKTSWPFRPQLTLRLSGPEKSFTCPDQRVQRIIRRIRPELGSASSTSTSSPLLRVDVPWLAVAPTDPGVLPCR